MSVSTLVMATLTRGPNWLGAIQKAAHDMNTIVVSGTNTFQT
jgi:hypothetical protein